MLKKVFNMQRAVRWRAIRSLIRKADNAERYRLLRRFGDEIRSLASDAIRDSANEWDINVTLELATSIGAILGGWWNAWPPNPEWPGRDRLFLGRRDDLLPVSCCLAGLGFFPVNQVAGIVDAALEQGAEGSIPGLEAPCLPPGTIVELAWESALESGRSKRRWRDFLGGEAGKEWADPVWSDSPETWRTCIALDGLTPEAHTLRDMPARGGERPAGLLVVAVVNRTDAAGIAEEWRAAGWEAVVVARSDCLGLYQTMTSAERGRPQVVVLAVGTGPALFSTRIREKRRDTGLLGEMSDEQFNALVNESLQF